jgi:hypothetical protein
MKKPIKYILLISIVVMLFSCNENSLNSIVDSDSGDETSQSSSSLDDVKYEEIKTFSLNGTKEEKEAISKTKYNVCEENNSYFSYCLASSTGEAFEDILMRYDYPFSLGIIRDFGEYQLLQTRLEFSTEIEESAFSNYQFFFVYSDMFSFGSKSYSTFCINGLTFRDDIYFLNIYDICNHTLGGLTYDDEGKMSGSIFFAGFEKNANSTDGKYYAIIYN